MRTLAIVPARAGSKGLPHKNTRPFRGEPLVGHAIRIGNETCNRTLVSTDDVEVARIAAAYHVSLLMRPPELATDEAPMLPVIQHALGVAGPEWDVVVLLQPTSPLRKRAHVLQALQLLEESEADSVVSVCEIPPHLSPDGACRIEGGELRPFIRGQEDGFPYYMDGMAARRQDFLTAYHRDGTVYAFRRKALGLGELYGPRCIPLVIPASESATIDTEEDWLLAEAKHG